MTIAISVRMDSNTLGALRTEAFYSGRNVNRIINYACRLFVELQDAKRRGIAIPSRGGVEKELWDVLERNAHMFGGL